MVDEGKGRCMKNPKMNKEAHIVNDIDMFAVSQNEMTGLFARPPITNQEMESYKSLFPFRADCDDVDHSTKYHDDLS